MFNTGILAAASAVASQPGRSASLVFILGAVATVPVGIGDGPAARLLPAARERMRRVEASLNIPDDQRTDTTSTLGGRRRKASVTQLVYMLLAAVCVADIVGAVIVAVR